MKKSVLFLINGLGIEKPGSYSISIDQCMPHLSRTKETSYFTTAVIDSIEYRSAYEAFFLGDSSKKELKYLESNILNDEVINNSTFNKLKNNLSNPMTKLHVFVEPTSESLVDQINNLINKLSLNINTKVYVHLLLTQQSVNEYKNLIGIINYIKFHLDQRITVGFILGKESISNELNKDDLDSVKKMFFYCSCERWSETEKKLQLLMDAKIRPCIAPGFCATNSCNITENDVILFFNTRRTNYDKFIDALEFNYSSVFKKDNFKLPMYSIIQLDSKHPIEYFSSNIVYDNSLSNLLEKGNKKCLIIADNKYISMINFLANGLNYVNNPRIQFMNLDNNYLSNQANITNLIDNTPYDLIIFDYHMDFDHTINELKLQLEKIDVVLGMVADVCENKHSLFITSLYGTKKDLPLAPYNNEIVTIDYEMQIPIFFFDYTYPKSKYVLRPGSTNDILNTVISCVWENAELYSLVSTKGGFLNSLFKKK